SRPARTRASWSSPSIACPLARQASSGVGRLVTLVNRGGAGRRAAARAARPRAWLAGRRGAFDAGLAAAPHPPEGVGARTSRIVGGLLAPRRTHAVTTARHEA